jgi:hypothetical protein
MHQWKSILIALFCFASMEEHSALTKLAKDGVKSASEIAIPQVPPFRGYQIIPISRCCDQSMFFTTVLKILIDRQTQLRLQFEAGYWILEVQRRVRIEIQMTIIGDGRTDVSDLQQPSTSQRDDFHHTRRNGVQIVHLNHESL